MGNLEERNLVIVGFSLIIASLVFDLILVTNRISFGNVSFGFFTEIVIVLLLAYLGIIEKPWALKLGCFFAAFLTLVILYVELTFEGPWVVYR
jgi:hypothetical protein